MFDFKAFRKANKMTQKEASEYFGCNQSFISHIERGENNVPEAFISKILADSSIIKPDYTDEGSKQIPYWNLPVSAGKSIVDVIGATKPHGYISGLPGADLAENILPVDGASMEPEVFPNALIGVRKMNNWETLNTLKPTFLKYQILAHVKNIVIL